MYCASDVRFKLKIVRVLCFFSTHIIPSTKLVLIFRINAFSAKASRPPPALIPPVQYFGLSLLCQWKIRDKSNFSTGRGIRDESKGRKKNTNHRNDKCVFSVARLARTQLGCRGDSAELGIVKNDRPPDVGIRISASPRRLQWAQ